MQLGRSRPRTRVSSPEHLRDKTKNALTASGYRMRKADADSMRRLIQPWQSRAFAYYDMLGEIKYAAQFYARGLSQLTLYAAEIDENGDIVETDNEDAKAALERIQDPGGGRSGLLSAYGRLMFLTGEAYLFVSNDPDTDMEQWEMLSTDELRVDGSGSYVRYKAPSLYAEDYKEPSEDDWEPIGEGDAVAYRLWQRHPRYSMLADSTMQGVLDLCEELVLLTQSVRSRARSRLAGSGILFLDDAISPAPPEPVGDEDPEEDVFVADLTEAMTTPIVDEGSASSVVPLVVRVPTTEQRSLKDLVHHLQIIDPTQVYPETGLRYECIKRIAIGLDMPPEELMGLQDSNHWSGWMVDEKTWKAHLQPKAQQFVDDVTSAYFRPSLKDAGVQDWQKFLIAYDASAIINHPDRTRDAKDLYDKRAIGKKALREASGFAEEDAMPQKELDEAIGIAVRDGSLATTGVPAAKDSVGGPTGEADPNDAGSAADVVKEAPAPPEELPAPAETVIGGGNGHRHEAYVSRVLGAADLALIRSREAAGNRIRSLAKRDPESLDLIDGVKAGLVAATLGRERVRALNAPSDLELVAGARDLIMDALRLFGIENETAVARIAENVEKHAARTLYDERPAPLPQTFVNYVAALPVRTAEPVA